MSTDVSGNNDKVLSILEQQLATNDPSIYRTATEKFGKWLDSPKAYYSRARPKIVALLQAADRTLKVAVNFQANSTEPFHVSHYPGHDMVENYTALFKTVAKYINRFVEANLRGQVRSLLKAIQPETIEPVIIDLSQDSSPPQVVKKQHTQQAVSVLSALSPSLSLVSSSASPVLHRLSSSAVPERPPSPQHASTTPSITPALPLATPINITPSIPTKPPVPSSPRIATTGMAQSTLPERPASTQHAPTTPSITPAPPQPVASVIQPAQVKAPVPSPQVATVGVAKSERATAASAATKSAKAKQKRKRLAAELLKADLGDVKSKRKEAAEAKVPPPAAAAISPPPLEGSSRDVAIDLSDDHIAPEPPQASSRLLDASRHNHEEVGNNDESTVPEGSSGPPDVAQAAPDSGLEDAVVPSAPVVLDAPRHTPTPFAVVATQNDVAPSDSIVLDITPSAPISSPEAATLNDNITKLPSISRAEGDTSTTSPPVAVTPLQSISKPARRLNQAEDFFDMDVDDTVAVATAIDGGTSNANSADTIPLPVNVTTDHLASKSARRPSQAADFFYDMDIDDPAVASASNDSTKPPSIAITQGDANTISLSARVAPGHSAFKTARKSSQAEKSVSDMELDASDLDEAPLKRRRTSPCLDDQVEDFLSSITRDVDTKWAGTGRSPLGAGTRQLSHLQRDLPFLALPPRLPTPAEVFASSIRLLMIKHMKHGSSARIEVDFEIPSEQWQKATLWTDRRNRTSEQVASSCCFSLGCCSSAQFADMGLNHPLNLRKLCSAYTNAHSWPTTGKFHLASSTADGNDNVGLDPPLLPTVDGLVDISFMLAEGTNSLCLNYSLTDSSYVVFMIHHAPTPTQLETFATECRKDEEWKDWISGLTKGISYPMSLAVETMQL